jgi:hypothetical protein
MLSNSDPFNNILTSKAKFPQKAKLVAVFSQIWYAFQVPTNPIQNLAILDFIIISGEDYKLWSCLARSFLQTPITSSFSSPNILPSIHLDTLNMLSVQSL